MATPTSSETLAEERDALKGLLESHGWRVFLALVEQEWSPEREVSKIEAALKVLDRGDREGQADTVAQIQTARREVRKVLALPGERLKTLTHAKEPERLFERFRRV